ncbi:hypothetical protein GCM10022416_37540 [Actinomadura keratinilytica]|uniref:Transposase n=1 Tax=Actinomadura keratinilytica TaxID=547461 RepID=A0ABP7Z2F1_9ACTN
MIAVTHSYRSDADTACRTLPTAPRPPSTIGWRLHKRSAPLRQCLDQLGWATALWKTTPRRPAPHRGNFTHMQARRRAQRGKSFRVANTKKEIWDNPATWPDFVQQAVPPVPILLPWGEPLP